MNDTKTLRNPNLLWCLGGKSMPLHMNPSSQCFPSTPPVTARLDTGPEAVRNYLATAGIPGVSESVAEAKISFLDTGILNYAYAIEADGNTLYLKQALEKAKKHDRIGPDLAGVPPDRILFEANFIRALGRLLSPEVPDFIPQILHLDEPNHILITQDVGKGGALLEAVLPQGQVSLVVAASLGRILGRIHAASLGQNCTVRGSAQGDESHWELFLRMRTVGCLKNTPASAEIAGALNNLYETARARHTRHVLLHADYCPKNLFALPNGRASVIDFELGTGVGEPAYDLGFLLGHYFLQTSRNGQVPGITWSAMRVIISAYEEQTPADSNLKPRAQKYAGATIFYRLFGSSRASSLKEEDIPALKKVASKLLLG